MILGVTGMIHPMSIIGITRLDFIVMQLSIILLWIFSFTKYTVARWEGGLLVALFLAYMTWLVMHAV